MQTTCCLPRRRIPEGERFSPPDVGDAKGGHASASRGFGRFVPTGVAIAGSLLVSLYSASSHGEMVFGYYAGYSYWQMAPEEVDWSGINCVLHFAADPHGDGTIDLNRFQLFPARIAQMVQLAREHGACVLLTVGGANTRWGFAEATASGATRARLVASIVDAVVDHGYDGVDLDWEPLQDSDAAAFAALVRELRAALDARAPGAMLTAAVPFQWGTKEAKNTAATVAGVIEELDFVHLMAYALAGPWGGWVSWHNSALANGGETFPRAAKQLPAAALMVEQYAAAGVPRAKMTLGLAFFGKIWQGGEGTPTGGVTAPRQSWTSKPTLSGEYQYHQIVARADYAGHQRWDEVAQNPYLSVDRPGAANDLFLPYENPQSITAKVGYAAEAGLGGVMIWELRGDYLPDRSHPLIAALKDAYQAHYGALPGDGPFDPGGASPDPDPAPAQNTLHVGDLDNSLLINGTKKWQAAVRVSIHGGAEEAVSGVSVTGAWSDGANAHCTTDSGGQCGVPAKSFSNKEYPSVSFRVTTVGRASFSYAPQENHDPDGDSDGNSITIMKPQ